jgi:hypothetical protein
VTFKDAFLATVHFTDKDSAPAVYDGPWNQCLAFVLAFPARTVSSVSIGRIIATYNPKQDGSGAVQG